MASKVLQEVKEHRWLQLGHISDWAVPWLQDQLRPPSQPYSCWNFSSWTSAAMTNLATDQVLKFTVKSYYNSQTYFTTYMLTVCKGPRLWQRRKYLLDVGFCQLSFYIPAAGWGSTGLTLLLEQVLLWAITDTNAVPKSTCRIAVMFNLSPNTSSYCN